MSRPYKPIAVGERFGTLVVQKPAISKGQYACRCVCDCGRVVMKPNSLLRKLKTGCGVGCPFSVVSINREKRKKLININGRAVEMVQSLQQNAAKRQASAIKLRLAGKTTRDIGQRLGISHERVAQYLRPLGIASRVKNELPAEVVTKALELANDGFYAHEIADQLQLKTHVVQAAVRGKITDEQRREAIKRRKTRDRAGFESHRLKFIRLVDDWKPQKDLCVFSCQCGTKEFISDFGNVVQEFTKSCGCLRSEYIQSIKNKVQWDTQKHQATDDYGRNWLNHKAKTLQGHPVCN